MADGARGGHAAGVWPRWAAFAMGRAAHTWAVVGHAAGVPCGIHVDHALSIASTEARPAWLPKARGLRGGDYPSPGVWVGLEVCLLYARSGCFQVHPDEWFGLIQLGRVRLEKE